VLTREQGQVKASYTRKGTNNTQHNDTQHNGTQREGLI
jgi:hypothetical protein